MTARRTRRRDQTIVGFSTQRREQHKLPNLHRDIVMLGFVAKRSRHPATARRYQSHPIAAGQLQHLNCRLERGECFLMAVAVKPDSLGLAVE